MKWAIIQIIKESNLDERFTEPCFKIFETYDTKENAIAARDRLENDYWYIVMQIW